MANKKVNYELSLFLKIVILVKNHFQWSSWKQFRFRYQSSKIMMTDYFYG